MGPSVAHVVETLRKLDKQLPAGEPIYLLLDTPGGSVVDGMNIVNTALSLDRPVHTITIFAASMGFVLVQHLGTRYILPNGVLMSHRGKVGANGEIGGELDELMRFFKEISRQIDQACAERLGMSLKAYQERIADEWWLYGSEAIKHDAADEIVVLKCSADMQNCPF
jgi:ATP-dependent protease ClpP protease subunit